jgi:signal peptidase I
LEKFQPLEETPVTSEPPMNPGIPAASDIPTVPETPGATGISAASDIPTIPETSTAEGISWKQFFLDLIETLLLAVILYLGINAISARVRVDGFSMNPTLQDGEYVLVSKLSYKLGEPQHGDIIVFKFPGGTEPSLSSLQRVVCFFRPNLNECLGPQDLIKRIVGLPGDVVDVSNGIVSVNGQALTEPYIAAAPVYRGHWEVPAGHLFVLGDNRNDSSDSHSWGLLPVGNVIGKALLIYWPPPEWNMINHFNLTVAAPLATPAP